MADSTTDKTTSPLTSSSSLHGSHHVLFLKLTSRNYVYWKTQVLPFLKGHRYYGYVNSTEPCPSDSALAETWMEQDAPILSILISSLSEEALPLAIGCDTSKDLWDALHNAYSSASTTRLLSLNVVL
ncbi:uncharacterized protein LOC122665666 [Telopea speciosissima]|uniref:uncharacterized protein LOC122665666 n=1 Tax=Telopea speciosissima TaxID=54955 RepID=UPI001CC53513|nr:uncharacterized protein LOC122665666 [Telopea speciosissima]